MSAAQLLQDARRMGVVVYADGGTIKMRGPAAAVQQVAVQLRPHRDEVAALLTRHKLRALPTLATPATFATDGPADDDLSQESQLSQHQSGLESVHPASSVARVAAVAAIPSPQTAAANDPPTVAKVATVAAPPTCHDCTHRTAAGTCGDPVAAGLAQTFGIRWPDPGHATRCPAYTPPPADPEPWREHLAQPADDAELETMARRVVRFEALGMPSELADRTADRLLVRDREGDTRQPCAECAACRFDAFTETWRCSSRMGMAGALQRIFVTEQLQRCPGFSLSHHLRPEEGEHHAE